MSSPIFLTTRVLLVKHATNVKFPNPFHPEDVIFDSLSKRDLLDTFWKDIGAGSLDDVPPERFTGIPPSTGLIIVLFAPAAVPFIPGTMDLETKNFTVATWQIEES